MGMGMGWLWLFWLLVVAGVVVLVVVAVRAVGGGVSRGDEANGRTSQGRSRARQVLDERYARGEIATEEYRERLRELGEDG
jgi:putative membrane protein